MREVAKKLLTVVALVLVLGDVVCCHVHNEECGYDEQTGKGCVYEFVSSPFNREPGQ